MTFSGAFGPVFRSAFDAGLAAASPASVPFPSDIANLVRWYKADAITALIDGDPVASWLDSSTTNDPAVQADAAKKPLYKTGILNSLPVVRFDGTNDFLAFTRVTDLRTAIMVIKHATGTQDNAPILGDASEYDYHGGSGTALFTAGATLSIIKPWINSTLYTLSSAQKPASFAIVSTVIPALAGSSQVTYFTNDRNQVNDRCWNGDYAELCLYTDELNDAQRERVEYYLYSKYGITPPSIGRIVFDGNSMTEGSSAPGNSYPTQCMALLGGTWNYFNYGITGQTTAQMSTNAATKIDPLFHQTRAANIYIPWEITNDLYGGGTATDAYNRYVALCQGRQAAGFRVVALTVLPRSNVGTPGGFEAARQTVNTNIRNNWATFADALADVAADTRIGDAGDETDGTYYNADLVHMTAAGYAIVAGIVEAAIDTL